MASFTAIPRRRRVLIVEDEAILGMEIEFLLSAAGYEVAGIAADARRALAMAREAPPDLALVDVRLKDGLTGLSVAEFMVAAGVAVLFMTSEPELLPEQFAGAYGVLTKPYAGPAVAEAVAYCLALLDGGDPGPPPYALRLAPWISERREADGLN